MMVQCSERGIKQPAATEAVARVRDVAEDIRNVLLAIGCFVLMFVPAEGCG